MKIKTPEASLDFNAGVITLKNISKYSFMSMFYDVQISIQSALKRFANEQEESSYYNIRDVYYLMQKKINQPKQHYFISFTIPQSRSIVKHFSHCNVSSGTLEIYSILDQKLPRFK